MRKLIALVSAVVLLAGCTSDAKTTAKTDAAPTGPPCIPATSSSAASPSVAGKPLPAMAVACFPAGRFTDVAVLGTEPTIVNLWASWCEPCRTELPAFQRFATAAAGKVRVVGVVTADSAPKAQSVIDAQRLTFPMLEDREKQFAAALGRAAGKPLANGLPGTVFIAPGGRVVYAYQGGDPLDDAKIRELTAQHLGVTVPA